MKRKHKIAVSITQYTFGSLIHKHMGGHSKYENVDFRITYKENKQLFYTDCRDIQSMVMHYAPSCTPRRSEIDALISSGRTIQNVESIQVYKTK